MSREINDRLKPEKTLSYADFHHEITKNDKDNSLKPCGNQQKQATCRKASEEDELVKYMSNLPGYLEKGEKIPDKALNVGVLDWATLRQWQYSHNHVPLSGRSSTSTSNKSSSVSTEGLYGNSGKGLVCSPSRQRIFRPSLESHFMASPMQDYSVSTKSSGGNFGNCQNLRGGCSNTDAHSKYARVGDHLSQNHATSTPKRCDRRQLNPLIIKESDILPNGRMYEAASQTKIEMSAKDDGPGKKVENFRQPNIDADEQVMLGKSKPIVLILPRDIPLNNHSEDPDMQTSLRQKLGSPTGTRFSEKPKEPPCRYPNANISRTCPLRDEIRGSRCQPKRSISSSKDTEVIKTPASTLAAPIPVRTGLSPCRSRKAEEKKHNIGASSSANGSFNGSDLKVTTEKSRSSSPFRRFSFSIGFTGKGSGCKEVAHVPHQSPIAALKSSSENVRGYASTKNSGNDKPGNASKSRSSSPLRRLLDPLLKPKTSKGHCSMESSQRDSVVTNKYCRSGNGEFSMEKELGRDQRAGGTPINTVDLSKSKKYVPSTFQALLRIAVKNGKPLFTFAVDNNSNILVATVKNLAVSKKDECSRIYTFFTFCEGKKKNVSWMNQASKSKGPNYIHHAVAQMKVADSHHNSTSQNCVDSSTTKEFVLFSVKLKQGDAQGTDYEPNDELAAIVVKSVKAVNFINYAHQSSCQNDNQDLLVTVVLPTGVHSLPSNGGPSSLIERWRTGGSCDCGGWDMACKLQILANESQACRKSRVSKACFPHPFELFVQANDQDQENQPALSFSPFKPGVYSVAFDSSFSLLQAFSICIALVDGLISYELSGSRNYIEGKNSRETLLVQTDELKAFGKLEDIPASYVAYPPLSPVGRV